MPSFDGVPRPDLEREVTASGDPTPPPELWPIRAAEIGLLALVLLVARLLLG